MFGPSIVSFEPRLTAPVSVEKTLDNEQRLNVKPKMSGVCFSERRLQIRQCQRSCTGPLPWSTVLGTPGIVEAEGSNCNCGKDNPLGGIKVGPCPLTNSHLSSQHSRYRFIKMVKSLFLLTAFLTSSAFANYYVAIWNNALKNTELMVTRDRRRCVCLKNTQTYRIMNFSQSDVKLFRSTDCTGNYDTVEGDIYDAQWVNSMSWGKSGIPSEDPDSCPNYFA
ncbi:MAG: hypothetical protein JOS17DRAFT_197830 [Linnemannia elongata]|nr:MAG: hypothetical protein JOS17DRAFT_197830 [Linnemannia elongata]